MVPSLTATVNYTDPTLEPVVTENSVIRQKIIDSQFKCYERMNRAPPYRKKGKEDKKVLFVYYHICIYHYKEAFCSSC